MKPLGWLLTEQLFKKTALAYQSVQYFEKHIRGGYIVTEDKKRTTQTTPEKPWLDVIIPDLKELVGYPTWRDEENEETVIENLGKIKDYFKNKPNTVPITFFEWPEKKDPRKKESWVFGFRAGALEVPKETKKPRKVSLICHLDTVPPGNLDWDPFNAREENRVYNGVSTPFLIGRGAIDDKGPAVVAFEAFARALRQVYEVDPKSMDYKYPNAIKKLKEELILEVLFDTSEETDMSTPDYLKANKKEEPDLGIVFDAYWSVRAEKGIERPTFTISNDVTSAPPVNTWHIADLKSSVGSANMIPVTAEAVINGKNLSDADLDQFVANIYDWYRACPFDDVNYHPADINVTKEKGSEVRITAKVAGAQHGSAPQQNRANGANPIVSLTNFLAFLVDRDILANNHFSEMCKFIRWAFGTWPFGENHPELLYRFDPVYGEGNGTTYGLTQLFSEINPISNKEGINLGIDVRYAIGHHGQGWDGREGKIKGKSIFKKVFKELTSRYKTEAGGATVTVETKTVFGPDIRSPRNAHLFQINNAYRSIMGENCPMRATGGATDAHGRLNLVTAGALLSENFGPPVNYHGIDEGAPLPDLENSGKILLYILRQELGISDKHESHPKNVCHGCCI